MTALVASDYLKDITRDTHARTLELLDGLSSDQLIGPRLPIVNPLLWEIGHVAWFSEHFIIRRLDGTPPIWPEGDDIYDSIAIPHGVRWDLPLLSHNEALDYIDRVEENNLARLDSDTANEDDSFIYQFAVFHNDMHNEAYTYSRRTLGYPKPKFAATKDNAANPDGAGPLPGDVDIPGGEFLLGTERDAPFIFDNEKWAHKVFVTPFSIAKAPVTNAEFAAFIADDGYNRRDLWHDVGWDWRQKAEAEQPVYWVPDGPGKWLFRDFDQSIDLPPHHPVNHVNWYEASAYCNWAKRRLPTELEWEVAASGEAAADGSLLGTRRDYPWGNDKPTPLHTNMDGRSVGCVDVGDFAAGDSAFGCRQMIGNIWEWTSSDFNPFPGFSPDPYKEYSEPVFNTRKVLKGGAWATRSRMVNNRHRNFFTPERRDVFGGFRTCARDY